MHDEKTTVFLTPEDVLLFAEFQKRYAFMRALESLGVFDTKKGSVEIHFDEIGAIRGIDIHRHYRLP